MACSFHVKYEVMYTLGKGNFGKVYMAESRKDGKQYAVKVVDKKILTSSSDQHIQREQLICQMFAKGLRHKNIVDVYDVFIEQDDTIYIVMDYIEGGELYDKIKQSKRLAEPTARRWFREIIEAVEYIHSHNIVHRDLKPENGIYTQFKDQSVPLYNDIIIVLIDKTQQIQICDFGFGNIMQQQHQVLNTYCGSPFYAAPEMVTATPYKGPPVDLWSCGVILYTMLTGSLPFHSNDMPRLFQKISQGLYTTPTNITEEAADLIRRLLCKDPKDRITASECLLHPWFFASDLSPIRKQPPQEEALESIVIPKKEVEKKKTLFMHIFKKKSQVAPLDANEKSALMKKADLLDQVKGFFRTLISKEYRLKK